jgi:hypothetical protein
MYLKKLQKLTLSSLYKFNIKQIHGFYFSIQPHTCEITNNGQEGIQVYQAPEWEELNSLLKEKNYFSIVPKKGKDIALMNHVWENAVMKSSFRQKYFSLIPFCVEDRQTQQAKKKFVLNMELYPESKHMKFQCSMLSGKLKIIKQ